MGERLQANYAHADLVRYARGVRFALRDVEVPGLVRHSLDPLLALLLDDVPAASLPRPAHPYVDQMQRLRAGVMSESEPLRGQLAELLAQLDASFARSEALFDAFEKLARRDSTC